MGHSPVRPAKPYGPSHGPGRRRHRSSSSTHILGRGSGRPAKTRGPSHGLGRVAQTKPVSHRPRPARAHKIKRSGPADQFSDDGPRPGRAHQIFRGWAPARRRRSIFQKYWPAHYMFKISARPGPARHIFKILGLARRAT